MRIQSHSAAELGQHDLDATIRAAFGAQTRIETRRPLGAGAFGVVHAVTLDAPPRRAVVKLHTYPNEGALEAGRLRVLRAHLQPLGVHVPHVYHFQPERPESPGDALVMEALEGVTGRQLGDPERLSEHDRGAVQAAVVELLLTLHSVHRAAGYGDFDGPPVARWGDYYGRRVVAVHRFLRTDPEGGRLHPTVLRVADVAAARATELVGTFAGAPTLIHAYTARVGVDPSFPLRYWFYMFWEWLSYYTRFGLDDPEWFLAAALRLDSTMQDDPRL